MSEVHLSNKLLKGKFLYYYAIIAGIYKHKSHKMKITLDDGTVFAHDNIFMLNLGNNSISGGGYVTCPKASMTDGKMDVMAIKDTSTAKRLKLLKMVQKGTFLKSPLVTYKQAKSVTIESSKPIAFHTEGEMYYTKKKKLTAKILPKYLTLLVK